jgi:hypothetical protein
MKSPKLILTCAVLSLLSVKSLIAQENKNIGLNNFSAISVSSGIDLYLTQGNAENIRLNAHPDLIKNIIVEKQGSNLVIKYKSNISWGRLFKGQSIKVYVNYKMLHAISASGGSDVYTENTLKTDKLSLSVSGGSDLKLSIVTKDLELQTSGGSDVALKGSAINLDADASGGSDIDAFDFVVENAKISISGGSDANIHVTKALDASASGGSDVHYKGNPSVKKSAGKSADIIRVD